ncbi:MAG: filamentous hemagglutinin N-terminal domain-containing protein [Deltaproteobacteria bacterium]|nr:filamentous hemagglutinin N-terminal domain-containing protein [Deltaproteobacteria bacterium]
MRKKIAIIRLTSLFSGIYFWLFAGISAYANPQGPQVVHGQAGFSNPNPQTLHVTNSPNAIINWQGFSIQNHEVTRFIQQSPNSAVLNRVTGPNPSNLLGQLLSNGKVFLINPHGMVFGPNCVIDTAGFVASTLNITDQDFLQGNLKFEGGPDSGSIINQGFITAGKNGDIYLIAPNIENSGIIHTDGGNLLLAAGESITITSLDLKDVHFEIQAPENEVLNIGKVLADGGAVNVFAGTLKHSGEIRADTVSVDETGAIILSASNDITLEAGSTVTANGPQGGTITVESENGTTLVSGIIQATGSEGKGGEIRLLGERVGLIDTALIDASGEAGGGTVLVGGDYQGKNPDIRNASATYVGPDVTITADAGAVGDGGKVIVWSDEVTRFYGSISARGGEQNGDGGFVETSGKYLEVGNSPPDVGAVNGKGGTWLLDPYNIEITPATNNNNAGQPTFTPNGDDSKIAVGLINTQLDTDTNVILDTQQFSGTQAGDVTFNANILKSAGPGTAELTVNADGSIIVNNSISCGSGNLNIALTADRDLNATGSVGIQSIIDTNGGSISIATPSGSLVQVGSATGTGPVVIDTGGGALTIDDGSAGNGGTLRLQGGMNAGAVATVLTGNMTVMADSVEVLGGTFTGSSSELKASGIQSITTQGNTLVQAGSTDGTDARIECTGPQTINATGFIHVLGGTVANTSHATIYSTAMQTVNANNILVKGGSGSGSDAFLQAGTGQDIDAAFVEVIGVGGDAVIDTNAGLQSIDTTGQNPNNFGILVEATDTGLAAIHSDGTQTINVNNADYVKVVGTIGNADISSNGAQSITLTGNGGAGNNEFVVGSATAQGMSKIMGNQQITTDALTVQAGNADNANAEVFSSGNQNLNIAGGLLQVNGGTAAGGSLASISATVDQTITANTITVSGGASGVYNRASINAGDSQDITAGSGGILVQAGDSTSDKTGGSTVEYSGNYAGIFLYPGATGSQTIVANSGGGISIFSGNGVADDWAAINSEGTGNTVTLNGGGNLVISGGNSPASDFHADAEIYSSNDLAVNVSGDTIVEHISFPPMIFR